MGDIFGGGGDSRGKRSETPQVLGAFPGQLENLSNLTSSASASAQKFLQSAGTPFQNTLSAGISPGQQFGFDNLLGALSSPLATETDAFRQALAATQRDVSGGLEDPFQNEFAQALQRNVKREIAEAKSRLASSSSARDQFSGGARIQGEEGIEARGIGEFTRALLPFAQQLEQNRQTGIGRLANFGLAQEQAPFQRIAQALQFGGQQQAQEQAPLDRALQEFMRQRSELGGTVNTAFGGSTFIPQFFQPTFGPAGPSSSAQLGDTLGGLAGIVGNIGGEEGKGEGLFGDFSTGSSSGDIQAALQVAALFSDATLKDNIQTIENPIDKIKSIRGVDFTWIEGDIDDGGVLAQELEKVLPNAVGERDGKKTVNYTAVIGLLIEAVKELAERN